MLAQRLDCPAPALGLFGVGLLYLLTRKSEESIYIGPDEAADIEGLANRLARSTATPADSARAGSFVRFLLGLSGVDGALVFARDLPRGVALDDIARQATLTPPIIMAF